MYIKMIMAFVSKCFYCFFSLTLISYMCLWTKVVASDEKQIDKDIFCDLPSLGPAGYMTEDGLIFHWNLCPKNGIKLTDLNPKCADINGGSENNDGTGDVCITKVNRTSKSIDHYLANAGVLEGAKIVNEGTGHLSILLDHGQKCENSQANYSTRFDFFCNDGEPEKDPQHSVMMTKFSNQCNFSLFWYTSLACGLEKQEIKTRGHTDNACKVSVPIYDQILDLKALSAKIGYSVHTDKKNFQLNICGNVKNYTCSSPLCEMDAKGNVNRTIFPNNDYKSVTTFDDQSNVLSLKYIGHDSDVSLDFYCMEDGAPDPNITFVEGTPKEFNGKETFTFKVRTRNVCMHPTSSCEINDPQSDISYDLSPLMRSKQDWVAYDTREGESNRRYHISVCKPLSPSSMKFECSNSRSAVCQTNEKSKESFDLGIVSKGIELQPKDQNSLIIRYENGSNCNGKDKYSSSVVFRCHDIELGPKMVEQYDGCHFLFEWRTPVACPNKRIIKSHDCKITDPVSGQKFDLSPLHNYTNDLEIKANGKSFKINICENGLHSDCGNQNKKLVSICEARSNNDEAKSIAFTSQSKLEYNEGILTMKYEGSKCRKGVNYSTTILFMCDHSIAIGKPEYFPSSILKANNECEYIYTWKTKLACATLEETECVVSDKDGNVYDLSSLSLSNSDYDISVDSKTKYLFNVCRNHVTSTSEAECPQNAAVCYGTLINNAGDKQGTKTWQYTNAGQVVHRPRIEESTKNVILDYEMGDICKDSATTETHIRTRINITCEQGEFNSQPEFMFQDKCIHYFFWRHNVACTKNKSNDKATVEENCSIKDSINNHEYDFNILRKMNSGYEFRDDDGNTYVVNICGSVQEGKESGITLKNNGSTVARNLGKYNNIVRFDAQNHLYMNYTNGDECVRGKNHSTYIRFICSPLRDIPTIFVERAARFSVDPGCTTFVNVFTALACPRTVSCRVPNSGINLSPLMDYQNNYQINSTRSKKPENILMNVCKPLASSREIQENDCSTASAICISDSKEGYKSFGQPYRSPRLESNGDVTLSYRNGSICNEMSESNDKKTIPSLRLSSTITFKCDSSTALGTPVPNDDQDEEHDNPCHRNFVWKTMLACKNSTIPTDYSRMKKPCNIYHPALKTYIDFSSIMRKTPYRANGVGYVKNKQNDRPKQLEYLINVCQPERDNGCAGSVCLKNTDTDIILSLGNIKNVIYSFAHDELIVHYTNGDRCEESNDGEKENKTYSAEIHFECDPNVKDKVGKPEIFVELPCHPVFNWKTSLVCDKVSSKPDASKSNGTFWVVLFLVALTALLAAFLWNPQRRERIRQLTTNMVQYLNGAGSRTDETNLLVTSNITVPTFDPPTGGMSFGRLSDDDDDELIIA